MALAASSPGKADCFLMVFFDQHPFLIKPGHFFHGPAMFGQHAQLEPMGRTRFF